MTMKDTASDVNAQRKKYSDGVTEQKSNNSLV